MPPQAGLKFTEIKISSGVFPMKIGARNFTGLRLGQKKNYDTTSKAEIQKLLDWMPPKRGPGQAGVYPVFDSGQE